LPSASSIPDHVEPGDAPRERGASPRVIPFAVFILFIAIEPLAAGVVVQPKMALYSQWTDYLNRLPRSMQEAIRSTIYHALSTSPPTQITFAWAAGYDYELTIWDAPDTRQTRGGITILIKSRYPDDPHPLSR